MNILFNKAKKLVNKRELSGDVTIGHVGCALRTKSGKIYTGLSVDTSANLGFCAEVCALADMIKNGETEIETIVAVGPKGKLITPCGRCRELMFQINRDNMNTKILVGEKESVTLKELLPRPWQDYWPESRD